jgi:YbbR domain-containing protein
MKKWLTQNRGIKVLCFFLALILWFYVRGEETSEIVFSNVPLNLINIPPELVPAEDTLNTISVGLRGQRRIISGLNRERLKLKAELDLESGKRGKNFHNLTAEKISLPSEDVKITSIRPAKIVINLEPVTTKRVSIKPKVTGAPGEGYKIKGIDWIPRVVRIKGPQSALRKLKEVRTLPLDISGISENLTKEVLLKPIGRYIEPVRPRPIKITVERQERQKSLTPYMLLPWLNRQAPGALLFTSERTEGIFRTGT